MDLPVDDRQTSPIWTSIARRIVEGVGVRSGDLVLVRGGSDPAVLEEVLLAVEEAGATPLPEIAHGSYLRRLLMRVDPVHLAGWDRHRLGWMRDIDRLISLGGGPPDFSDVPPGALEAWEGAVARLGRTEEERRVPFLVVALPDRARAAALGMSVPELEAIVLPALAAPTAELRGEIDRVLPRVRGARSLTLHTGASCELRLTLGARPWLTDDGVIDEEDRTLGAGVSNLPAGSIYTTVIEDATEGTVQLPQAGPADDAVLRFEQGRIVDIQARQGAADLAAMFDRHTGESRRISHVGIGLNPRLRRPIGWVLVDEHVHGAVFVALGENRYMGGENASSLNIDFCVPDATLVADGRGVVRNGVVAG